MKGIQSWIFMLVACIGSSAEVQGQRLDSFEGGAPRWRLVESDCQAQIAAQEISLILPHGGRTSELIDLACSNGNLALLAYPIEPCAVLDEFQPSVWLRCASGQLRLGVRVVFPKAMHPLNHSRVTAILWGDMYTQPGQWQRLQVKQMGEMLKQEVSAIRNQFDTQVNLDSPLIDALVINAYAGPGRTKFQVDDLDMGSMIPLASTGIPLPANWRDKWSWRDDTQAQFSSNKQVPLWVDSRGEQPAWLQSLGFNGLLLPSVPSTAQLDQIYELGMGVISPPPQHLVEFDQKKLMAVKGWMIGTALNRGQIELARELAANAERLPQSMKRPLIGEALEHFWLFGRIANQIIVPAPDPISAGSALEKRSWLGKNLQTTKARGDGWASVYVGSNPALSDQYRAAVEKLDGHSPPSPPANPMALRMEVVGALMAGAKGILYKTQSPLLDPISSQSPDDLALQAALRWTNHELKLWSPWIAYGQQQSAPQLSRADFAGALWRVRDADLIVAQNVGAYSQQCLPATRNTPLRITLPGTSEPHQVFRLSESRLELLRLERTAGDESWQVESPNPIEILVVTGNPQVTNYLRQQLNRQSTEVASDQLELANYYLQQASELIEARFGVSNGGSSEELRARSIQQQRIAANQRLLERGWQALQANQTADASSLALQSLDQTRAVLHESFLVAIENLASPQASPLVLTPGTLKYHWLLANACQRSTWQTLELPGSQFSNLETMQSSGWHQERRLKDQVDFRVELIPADNSTSAGLRLAAYPKTRATLNFDPVPGGYEGASLFVRSAGAPVRKGQLVRVSAVATIREVGNDPAAGLLIYDNQAWTSLGQLIRGKPGERIPVELYRFVIQDGEFRIQAECRGLCDVQLEMLQASVIEPATNFRRYDTVPREPVSSDEYSDASAQLKSALTPVPR